MNKRFILLTILFFTVLLAIPLSLFVINRVLKKEVQRQTVVKQRKSIKEAKIIGWTAYWDEANSLNNLINASHYLYSISPIFYKITPDGSLGRTDITNRPQIIKLAKQQNKTVIPVIGDDFDFERVGLLLYDKSAQEKFIEQLVEEATREGFVGWDIDIESLRAEDKEAFTDFIVKAADVLHRNELELNVIVFAKTGNDDNEVAIAQDYQALGKVANQLRIMLYGRSYEETPPGGQTPLSWIAEVLRYAVNKVAKEKIVVGLSTHGYDWGGGTVRPLTFQEVQKIVKEASASVSFNQEISSAVASYQRRDENHVIWYEDAQAIAQKIEYIINEFDIDKFALWRIGAEDPDFWNLLK